MAGIILERLMALFILMLLGYLLAKVGIIDDRVAKGLSAILTNALLPALVVGSLQLPYSIENVTIMGFAALGMVAITAVGALISWLPLKLILRARTSEIGIWMFLVGFSNCLFMGQPLMAALYGDEILFAVSAMAIAFNLLCFSVGVYFLLMGRTKGDPRAIARAIVNPTTVAGTVGLLLFFFSIRLPNSVTFALDLLTGALTPVSMLIIGYSLVGNRFHSPLKDWKIYALSALRLIICPLIVYVIMNAVTDNVMVRNIILIAAAMPIASMGSVMGKQYDHPDSAFAAKCVVASTVLVLGTAPLLFALLQLGG